MRMILFLFFLIIVALPVAYAETLDQHALKVLYDENLDRSVAVILYGQQYGTGWWIGPDFLITAAHVVDNVQGAQVTIVHGSYTSQGTVIALDKSLDIAVVQAVTPMPDRVDLPLCTSVSKGQEVIVVGYPYETVLVAGGIKKASNNPRAAYGTIAWVGTGGKEWLAEVHATTDQGNSGGPVIDVDSKCSVGLITFALKGDAGILYYITNVYGLSKFLDASSIPYNTTPTGTQQATMLIPSTGGEKLKYVAMGAGVSLFALMLLTVAQKRRILAMLPAILTLGLLIIAPVTSAETLPLIVTDDDAPTIKGSLKPGMILTATMKWKVEASYFKQEKEVFDSEMNIGPIKIKAGLYKDAPGLKSYYAGIWAKTTTMADGGAGGGGNYLFKMVEKYGDTAQGSYTVKVSYTCDKHLKIWVNDKLVYNQKTDGTPQVIAYDDDTSADVAKTLDCGTTGNPTDPIYNAPGADDNKTVLYAAAGAGIVALAGLMIAARSGAGRRAVLPVLAGAPLLIILSFIAIAIVSFTLGYVVGSNWKAAVAGAGVLLLGLLIIARTWRR